MKTICLNMIVKDEAKVIRRCLGSLKKWIDYWVIVDTGSTDGTQEMIREFMKDVPGELHQSSWVNFAHNRNEALSLSKGKGDYILFIDADEMLEFSKDFTWPELIQDLYFMKVRYQTGSEFSRVSLVNNRLEWKWHGVIHEELRESGSKRSGTMLNGVITITTLDGEPSKELLIKKNLRDAAILEKALLEEPDSARYMFHLGLTYETAEENEKALKVFEKRVAMGGEDDGQIFYSLLRIARLQEKLKMSPDLFIATYQRAYQSRPTRAEPLYHLACHYLETKNPLLSYALTRWALTFPVPKNDLMLVDLPIYEFYLLLQLVESALQLGKVDEAKSACQKLLSKPNLPVELRKWADKKVKIL
ncbi:MAG: glycosyltransferase [Verrucomicrobia bacterium]|nr:glycosyltransferase [Verrucomicrobiota bacterium]